MTVQVDAAIAAYIKLRNMKAEIENKTKAEVETINKKLDKLEVWLKSKADEVGTSSFKTPAGTAFLSSKDNASVADWDVLLGFITEKGAYDLLNKAVNKSAVRAYLDETKTLPPGVNYSSTITVSVRKPTTKADD
jgi:hypothetical protein